MKGLIIFLVTVQLQLTFINNCLSQGSRNSDILDFSSFIALFENSSLSNDIQIEVPKDAYSLYFKEESNDRIVLVLAIELLNASNAITILCEIIYPEGGHTSSYQLATFSEEGKLINKSIIGGYLLDDFGGISTKCSFYENTLLEVHRKNVRYNESNRSNVEISNEEYTYYIIDGFGYKVLNPVHSQGRSFPEASNRLIPVEQIQEYSKEEIDIMRNEIFADHGYIFKSTKWEEYFSNQDWYEPKYISVDDLLTAIEKINIERILSIGK